MSVVTIYLDFVSDKEAKVFTHRVHSVLTCPTLRYDNLLYIVATSDEEGEVSRIAHLLFGVVKEKKRV